MYNNNRPEHYFSNESESRPTVEYADNYKSKLFIPTYPYIEHVDTCVRKGKKDKKVVMRIPLNYNGSKLKKHVSLLRRNRVTDHNRVSIKSYKFNLIVANVNAVMTHGNR